MLKGKTALVTGSVIGRGNATARAMAAQAWHLRLSGCGEREDS